ncbi:hypothetical protein NC653_016110 [Populus alba x Populus x berolinensis]|uniref:Uncharacterized protein n=1 Tax=Populus alba x Populus x berolinensis TaxID=444605 RepID=A0AAD6VYU4_9ROSI|nr:hypothetical protein NC653_016110 [Populus alba x Populus x berolinensis]
MAKYFPGDGTSTARYYCSVFRDRNCGVARRCPDNLSDDFKLWDLLEDALSELLYELPATGSSRNSTSPSLANKEGSILAL